MTGDTGDRPGTTGDVSPAQTNRGHRGHRGYRSPRFRGPRLGRPQVLTGDASTHPFDANLKADDAATIPHVMTTSPNQIRATCGNCHRTQDVLFARARLTGLDGGWAAQWVCDGCKRPRVNRVPSAIARVMRGDAALGRSTSAHLAGAIHDPGTSNGAA